MLATLLEDLARDVLASALAGGDWVDALEPIMTELGAMGGGPARVVPPHLFAAPTSGVRDLFAEFRAGRRPPLTRDFAIAAMPDDGFVADYMSPAHAARRRDPFYNEFMRPRGACHEVVAYLDETDAGCVRLLVFREARHGPFEASELQALTQIQPYLRSAAMVSRASALAKARRQAEPFDRRGEPVFYLGSDGRLLEANTPGEWALCETLKVVRRRLTTPWPGDKARLDRAVTAALVEERPSLVALHAGRDASPVMALVLPVSGAAKDLFDATSAIVVLVDPARRQDMGGVAIDQLDAAAGLTRREIDVVRLVAAGRSPQNTADELGIGHGTTRNHLKAAFAKLGVHSQSELVALIQRLH